MNRTLVLLKKIIREEMALLEEGTAPVGIDFADIVSNYMDHDELDDNYGTGTKNSLKKLFSKIYSLLGSTYPREDQIYAISWLTNSAERQFRTLKNTIDGGAVDGWVKIASNNKLSDLSYKLSRNKANKRVLLLVFDIGDEFIIYNKSDFKK